MKERYAENNALFRDIVNLFFVVFLFLENFASFPSLRVFPVLSSAFPLRCVAFPHARRRAFVLSVASFPAAFPLLKISAREQVFRCSPKFTYKPTRRAHGGAFPCVQPRAVSATLPPAIPAFKGISRFRQRGGRSRVAGRKCVLAGAVVCVGCVGKIFNLRGNLQAAIPLFIYHSFPFL